MEIEPPDSLFGLYQGTPLPERSWGYGNTLPDRISIYQQPIEEACEDDEEIRDCVAETVIHEFGHYFGMDEEQIEEIEEKYWRGESLDDVWSVKVRAKKQYGQHFLEAAWADKLVAAIEPHRDDRFVEIGPGPGALTLRLAPRVGRVTAIELDRDMVEALAPRLPGQRHADARRLSRLRSVASTTRRAAVSRRRQPPLQRVVADSVSAARRVPDHGRARGRDADAAARGGRSDHGGAWNRRYGVLSISVQMHADVRRVLALPPGAFRPPPKVHSAVVHFRFRPPAVALADEPCSRRWCARCSRSGERPCRTPWGLSRRSARRDRRRPRWARSASIRAAGQRRCN